MFSDKVDIANLNMMNMVFDCTKTKSLESLLIERRRCTTANFFVANLSGKRTELLKQWIDTL